jgi:pimeloyl-ACP methyl ester carboxylesterase
MAFFERAGTQIFATEHGAGPSLVLIHGWTCDGNDWSHQVTALAEGYRVIVLDNRGHGRSSLAADGEYSPSAFATDAMVVMDGLGIERAVVLGHSLGFTIAVHMALAAPERVHALVDVDGACAAVDEAREWLEAIADGLDSGAHEVAAAFAEENFYQAATPAYLRAWHERRIHGMEQEPIARAFQGFARGPEAFIYRSRSGPALASLKVPVLAFRMRSGTAAWEREVLAHPDSRVIAWDGSGHFLHQERPAEFNALVLEWLAELPPW